MTQPAAFFDVPPLRYTGGKWKLADWLISYFPPHDCYVEPYCGGASVFFRKHRSKIEVLNDLSSDVVNFFQVLRSRPDELIGAIELTPYAREEYEQAYQPCEDELERARRFYVLSRQAFGGQAGRKTGWRAQRNWHRGTSINNEWRRLSGLRFAVNRLKDAQIENRDALRVLEHYDTPRTLFYVDPPYVYHARSDGDRQRYLHEMTDNDHRALAEVLHQLDGMVLLSGYDSPLYRELYADWIVMSKTATTNGNSTAEEFLWISPNAAAAKAQHQLWLYFLEVLKTPQQLSLF